MIPQATATIGIIKVTVDANSGLETLINLYCNIMASPVPKMDKVATNPNPIMFSLVNENSWKKFEKYKANKDGKNKTQKNTNEDKSFAGMWVSFAPTVVTLTAYKKAAKSNNPK